MSTVAVARVWKHTSGLTASVRGACPWTTEADKLNWKMVNVGWTVVHPDGTSGLGRKPFLTREGAQDWCDKNPTFPGMGAM
jgi:hypothetical protein